MATKGTIWRCPLCGVGKRGPVKPRRNNIVRYCLDCSKTEGVLVETTSRTLERKRAAGREKTKAKAEAKREQAKDARMVAGIDIMAEARRVWRLPSMREQHRGRRLPEINWRIRRSGNHSSGVCYARGEIHLTLPPGNPASVYTIILHELAHAACPSKTHHGSLFWSVMRSAAEERFPGITIERPEREHGWYRHYAIDRAIDEHLQAG